MTSIKLNSSISPIPLAVKREAGQLAFSGDLSGLSFGLDVSGDASLNELLAIFHKPIYFLSPAEKKMFQVLNQKLPIEYLSTLPKQEIKRRLNEIFDSLEGIQQNEASARWIDIFAKNYEFVNSFGDFKIDQERIERLEIEAQSKAAIRQTINSGAIKPKYSFSSTVTGRLTITNGLNFLVLPKSIRGAILPLNPDEKIWELDLSALEPYIFLKFLKPDFCIEQDLYEDFSNFWFEGKIDRETSKQILISLLYGAGDKNIISLLGITSVDKNYIHEVKKRLGMNELSDRLLAEYNKAGYILNAFGRPVYPKEQNPKPGTLINNFIQSSAVDVAIDIFSNLAEQHAIKPLFMIHDALYFSADKSAAEEIKALSSLKSRIIQTADFRFKIKTMQE
jgi:hypothetical protein